MPDPYRQQGVPDPNRWLGPGFGFYAVLAASAWLWRGFFYDEPLWFVSAAEAAEGVSWGPNLGLGLLAGCGLLGLSAAATRFTRMGARLADRMGRMLAGLSLKNALLLALLSGFAEELFFRGALQPRVGFLAASLLFGLVHVGPGRDFLAWTFFAVLAGGLFGGLFLWTGNLVAPVVAHVVVNAVNLPLLARRTPLSSRYGRPDEYDAPGDG